MSKGLKYKTAYGFLWNAFGTLTGGVLSFIVTMILARLLTPSDFGMIALLTIFSSISAVIIDSGFSKAIIRDKNPSQTDLSSVFFLNIIIASIIYFILFFLVSYIALFFEIPLLKPLSRVVFLTLIFNSFSLVQTSVLSQKINFRVQSKANVIAAVVSGIIAICMAYWGMGVWALVANMVGLSLFRSLYLVLNNTWRPTAEFSFRSIKKYFLFGSNLLAQNMADKIVSNLEAFIIGKYYTKLDLGLFSQSRNLNTYITTNVVSIIQTVTYPALAKLDKNMLKDGYRKVLVITMFVLMPMTIFVSIAADNAMVTLFGARWIEAGQYLNLWNIIGLLVAIYSIFINVFLVTGETGKLLKYSLIRQVFRIISIILLARISVMAMLWGILVVTAYSCIQYAYRGGKIIDYSIKEIILDIWPILYKSLIAGGGVYAIGVWGSNWARELQFVIQLVVMSILYFILMHLMKDSSYVEVRNVFKIMLKKQ